MSAEVREPGDQPESSQGKDEEVVDHDLETETGNSVDSVLGSTEAGDVTRGRGESPDPIDCFTVDPPHGGNTEQISQGMKDLEVGSARSSPRKRSSPTKRTEPTGREIDSAVLQGWFRVPNEREAKAAASSSKGKNAETPEKPVDHDIVSSDR